MFRFYTFFFTGSRGATPDLTSLPQTSQGVHGPSSSWLYASDTFCTHASGGLYAPIRHMGDNFVVKIAAWTPGEGEGAGRIAAGKGGAPVGLVEIFAVVDVEELPEEVPYVNNGVDVQSWGECRG